VSSLELTPAQRAAAVDRIQDSLVLVSGAGCGKTFVLARRFVELLLAGGDDVELSRFVALTFTEKAALEMSQRVRAMLVERAANASGAQRERLRRWIEELPEARISTIHGFCASVLRAHAIDAGVDPGFTVCADDLLATRLRREAAEEALLSSAEAGDPGALDLLGRYRLEELTEVVSSLMDQRTSYQTGSYEDADAILTRWKALLEQAREEAWHRLDEDQRPRDLLADLGAFRCEDDSDRLYAIWKEVLSLAPCLLNEPSSRTPDAFAELQGVSTGSLGSDKAWGGKGFAKEVRDAIKAVKISIGEYADFAEPLGPRDAEAAAILAALAHVTGDASLRYADAKRARGLLDFTDLLECTGSLLSRNRRVREAIGGQIDQLLIDECQDTDAYQLKVLRCLVFGDASGGSDASPSGRLFVVGDAKQSIYRFRGAQVEVFRDLCERIGRERTESLDRSFRTHAAGVAFVNELFAPLMGSEYAPIEAHRVICPPQPSVEILLAEGQFPTRGGADKAVEAEASVTAQRIDEMLRARECRVWDDSSRDWRAVRPGDIAILFARMTSSLRYEWELQRRGIPYYVVGGTGFFRRQEVLDVLNALRAAESPTDDVAFMGALRSSLFGLDDNALAHVAQVCRPPYLPALEADGLGRAAEGLASADSSVLAFAVELLLRLGRHKDAVGVDRLIEQLLTETSFEATLLAQFQGRRMLGNVRLLLERARSAASEGVTLADFLTQMDELVLNEARYEQAVVAGEAADVVRIMTIHKAKGLEFPVVFIPDLNAARQGPRGELLIRHDWGLTWHLRPNADDEEDASDSDTDRPVSSRIARRYEKRDQDAEDIRKWYVAATRHRDHLVWVGANWRNAEGGFRNPGSFLSELDLVLGLAHAAETGQTEIRYGAGQYVAELRLVAPAAPQRESGPTPPGERMLTDARSAEDFAEAIRAAAQEQRGAPPLLGPLPVEAARAEVAVTALGDFAECPMLYRWRYELRLPDLLHRGGSSGAQVAPLDAATLGTFYHRCMELLEFRSPQTPVALVAQVAAEMELSGVTDLRALARELSEMIDRLRGHEMWPALHEARELRRELDFVMELGSLELRGQIDLIFLDASGAWHIVDYKSDRLGKQSPSEHARRYELQMLTYALAAGRFLQQPVADATLYFLRHGSTHCFELSELALAGAEQRIGELAKRLVRARRTGAFERGEKHCAYCPYQSVCNPAGDTQV
jgi:ATP-dependent helicase/nuclease subunit A